jgi:hypothetical protein
MKVSYLKILLKIHLYGGLLFFPYLLIFGLSSLNINHQFSFFDEKQYWEEPVYKKIQLPSQFIDDNQNLSEAVRDSLNLMGWCPWWNRSRSDSTYRFLVMNFGNEYKLNLNIVSGDVEITRRYKGLPHIFKALHFLGEQVPNANFIINSWKYFQNLTVFYVIFAAAIGVVLFLKRQDERRIGLFILFASFSTSILFMIYIWLLG